MTIQELVREALLEDVPERDLTTEALGIEQRQGRARLLAQEDLVLSGVKVFETCIRYWSPELQCAWLFQEGELVLKGQTLCKIEGDLVPLLKTERTALNFLGHLCGVATYTRCFVNETKDTSCRIESTRHTLPLMRELEHQAVAHGQGDGGRQNLGEHIMIQQNHIHAAGGLAQAVSRIRARFSDSPIAIEVRKLEEVPTVVKAKAEAIVFVDMSLEDIARALEDLPKRMKTKARGCIELSGVAALAELGLDSIAIGALTHSAPFSELGLAYEWMSPNG